MEPSNKYITGIYTATSDLTWKDKTRFEDKKDVFFETRSLLIDSNTTFPDLFVSPTFDWGCRSRGTKQVAISMLLEIAEQREAVRYADDLVSECLSLIPSHAHWNIQIHALRKWLLWKKGHINEPEDLMRWAKIEDPAYKQPVPLIETTPRLPLIIPIPTLEQKREKDVKVKKHGPPTKYPFNDLEVGDYFYFIDPNEKELKIIGTIQAMRSRTSGKKFVRRTVTAEWAREHKIPVAQTNVRVCIIWRTE